MTESQRKIEQMKLHKLWKEKRLSSEKYAEKSVALLMQWSKANYGRKAS